MGSSKLIARKPRNHLQTQTSAYTLVAYGERARAQTCKVVVYLHFQGGALGGIAEQGAEQVQTGVGGWVAKGSWGRGRRWAWAGTAEPTWMFSGGHRRQHVSGTPESQLQGGVGQVDTGSGGGTLVCSDGPLCTRGQLVQFPSQLEQRWLRRWGRQRGHRLQSPVPVLLANEWLGLEVPTLDLGRPPPQLCLPPRLNHSLALPKGW